MLADQILPRVLEEKGGTEPVRCWSAGSASGEEAYTLAMLLAEAMGEQEFRQRVKIYATDVDDEALAQGRQGSYTAAQIDDIPQGFLKYFEPAGERFVFRPTSGVRSSSAATTCCRTRRSRGSTCWSAATR